MDPSDIEHVSVDNLVQHAREFYEFGWAMGTSGNLSARIDAMALITATGTHLGELDPSDFVRIPVLEPPPQDLDPAPSHETVIHRTIYRQSAEANAVYHVHEPHGVAASSRAQDRQELEFEGYSILKAFGLDEIHSPAVLPILEETGNPEVTAAQLENRFENPDADFPIPAALVRRHGLFVWGTSPAAARRHTEALAHLLEVRLREMDA